jgi:hypothetical protein
MTNIHPADALGFIKAQIADLESKAKIQHARLVAMGAGAYEGETFRATVSIAPRETIDWKGIAETLKPSLRMPRDKWSEQVATMVADHSTSKDVTTVRTNARTAVAA